MRLYGREQLIAELVGSTASVTLLIGDSGVGKSSVLEAARVAAAEHHVAPPVVTVRHAPGALQLALLGALGGAVASVARDTTATERVAAAVGKAARRVTEARLQGLAHAVGQHLLGIVRAHVGDLAGDALEAVAAELSTSEAQRFEARIANQGDNDVVDMIVRFASDALTLTQGASIVLSLDDVDRLTEDDQRRLIDLTDRLPTARVLLRAAFSTWDTATRRAVDRMRIGGASAIDVPGLSVQAIRTWLRSRGMPLELTPSVHKVTGGYGLHVNDALALLEGHALDPSVLDGMGPDDVLARRAGESLRQIDHASRWAASQLAAFSDPLPMADRASYLGMDPVEWGIIEAALTDSGPFLEASGRWFHELRRRHIWGKLDGVAKASASDRALEYIREHAGQMSPRTPALLLDFVRLAPTSTTATSQAHVAAVLTASKQQLAVAAALLELSEPNRGSPAVHTELVLHHVRDTFGTTGDLVAALQELEAMGLVHIASNHHASVAAPLWDTDRV